MKIDISILKEGTMISKCQIISCLSPVLWKIHALPNDFFTLKCHETQPLPGIAAEFTITKS